MIKLTRPACPNPTALRSNYKHPENKKALQESSFNKCMYCESRIEHIDYGDVEHIKPKTSFPDLEFDWDNLGYACPKCNREYKNDQYDEKLINPYQEDPEQFLHALNSIIFSINTNDKGEKTLDLVKLNRPSLLERRTERLDKIRLLIRLYLLVPIDEKDAIKEQILIESSKEKEYSLCVTSLIKSEGLI